MMRRRTSRRSAARSASAAISADADVEETGPPLALHIVVHSLDGTGMRERGAQQILCFLAGVRGIRVTASVDNIHAGPVQTPSRSLPLRRPLLSAIGKYM